MTVGPDAAVVEEVGPPPTRRDGQRWAAALEEIVELVERRAGDNPHPGWRAPTWPELAATVDERTSHGRWGELPYKTIWTTHAILARAVCEHGRAFALLLRTNPAASLALDTQARTMVELAAQASWLMWPDVGGRARVARLHVLRRRTAIEHDRLGRHLGLDPDADHPATLAAIDTYAETLGRWPMRTSGTATRTPAWRKPRALALRLTQACRACEFR